ncbi:MAG: class I SAM-dependent methyltransferase [Kofleriaceae bacterium]|nr:class I SAM-dependent methyltransferase [Kofleriaceae bacterium]
MEGDRERWNAKWRERAGELEDESPFLAEHAHLLPARGKALDVAGGAGRNAIWLARRGLDVTLVDISDVALEKADRRAAGLGIAKRLRTLHVDLDTELPLAPLYDLVLVFNYLNRARRDSYASLLAGEGLLVALQPTVTNLERHASPSRPHLVERGELEDWARALGMEIVVSREGWTDANRHEAAIIARRLRPEPIEPGDKGPSHGPYR